MARCLIYNIAVDKSDNTQSEEIEELGSATNDDLNPVTFAASLNAHGKYETMRFVLSLSPINHSFLDSIETEIRPAQDFSPETLKAYSTYVHETIHWWQHVGVDIWTVI